MHNILHLLSKNMCILLILFRFHINYRKHNNNASGLPLYDGYISKNYIDLIKVFGTYVLFMTKL